MDDVIFDVDSDEIEEIIIDTDEATTEKNLSNVEQMLEKTLSRIKAELSDYKTSDDESSKASFNKCEQKRKKLPKTKAGTIKKCVIAKSSKETNVTNGVASIDNKKKLDKVMLAKNIKPKNRFSIVASYIEQFENDKKPGNRPKSQINKQEKNAESRISKETTPTCEREVSRLKIK
jgi:hypothetical protein